MSKFQGFPSRTEFTPVPNAFFGTLLAEIDDVDELKVTLHVIAALYPKKGSPRYVSFDELLGATKMDENRLRGALDKAVERGTVLSLTGDSQNIYFLNDEPGRQSVCKIESGELKLGDFKAALKPEAPATAVPDIFALYEENIGMLTPMVADELKEIEKLYPPEWLRDAVREAALHNKRNIRYFSKILENWSTEGRSNGTYQRDIKKTDPDRFIKGKYGHMVRR